MPTDFLQVEKFVEEECIPADPIYMGSLGTTIQERFNAHPKIMEDLKTRARELGLWNMFLPRNHFKEGAGFSNLEYGLMAEYLGKSRTASEVGYSRILRVSNDLTSYKRPATAPLPTPATWRSWPSTATRPRSASGSTRCSRERFVLPSS